LGSPDLRHFNGAEPGQARVPMPSTSLSRQESKTWMPGMKPGMTSH
jgi:hypothetical protein